MGEATQVAAIAAGLTKAQRWFVCALSESWVLPGDIKAKPNHGANRDLRLIITSHDGQGREYRLTPLGLAVRAHLMQERP